MMNTILNNKHYWGSEWWKQGGGKGLFLKKTQKITIFGIFFREKGQYRAIVIFYSFPLPLHTRKPSYRSFSPPHLKATLVLQKEKSKFGCTYQNRRNLLQIYYQSFKILKLLSIHSITHKSRSSVYLEYDRPVSCQSRNRTATIRHFK